MNRAPSFDSLRTIETQMEWENYKEITSIQIHELNEDIKAVS